MEILKKNLIFSYKLLKAHFFLVIISYGFCALNYTYILAYKKKYFFVIFITIQTLLLIFMFQTQCLMKYSFFSAIEQTKCALNVYAFFSVIFFILVVIQYYLIFSSFKSSNIYKITLICISLAYYIFDVFIFIYEYYTIFNQIKKTISERIRMQNARGRNIEKICKKETEPSEKSKSKKNEPFEKEDTFYIIYGYFDKNNNSPNSPKKICNTLFNEINNINSITCNKGRNKNININRNKKFNFLGSQFEKVNDSNRKLGLNEVSKSHSFEKVKKILPISKEIQITTYDK